LIDDPRRDCGTTLDFDEGDDNANVQNLPPHFHAVRGVLAALYRGNRVPGGRLRHSVTGMVQIR
jgi:hypothetical protein